MYKPVKFNCYWYVCLDGVPVKSDQYHYASECQEECDRMNEKEEA